MRRRFQWVVAAAVGVAALAIPMTGSAVSTDRGADAASDGVDSAAGPLASLNDAKRVQAQRVVPPAGTRLPAERLAQLQGRTRITATVILAGSSVTDDVVAARASGRDLDKRQRTLRRRALADLQRPVIDLIRKSGVRVITSMQDVVNGVVVSGTASQIRALSSLPGVVAVSPSRVHRRANASSNGFSGVSTAWESLGFTGVGQVIAVIDSGVDYTHSNFGGSGNPADYTNNDPTRVDDVPIATSKIIRGFDLVGDAYDPTSDLLEEMLPNPDPDPRPCDNHGTHVAGTAAGYGVTADGATFAGPYTPAAVEGLRIAPGAAPHASIVDIKVFGCGSGVDEAVLVSAIDLAVREGATVINLSVGISFGTSDNVLTKAVNTAARAGTLSVISAGNDGWSPYLVASPATADRGLAVAAIDGMPSLPSVAVSLGATMVTAQNSNLVPSVSVSGELVAAPAASGLGTGCTAADLPDVTGKVLLVKRGECDRTAKAVHGQSRGALAVIMVNDVDALPPLEGGIEGVTIPFVGARLGDEAALVGSLGSTVTIAEGSPIPNPLLGEPAEFTSAGPRNGDSAFKPDVSAHGVNVLSAAMGSGSGATLLSGTSMAAPHVAGIAALVRQAHPTWSASQVKAALMNTARRSNLGLWAEPRVVGNGAVSAGDALRTGVLLTTTDGTHALSFGYRPTTGSIDEERHLRITNLSGATVRYRLDVEPIGEQFGAVLRVTPSVVTLKPGQHRTVHARITMAKSAVAALPSISNGDLGPGGMLMLSGRVVATPIAPTPTQTGGTETGSETAPVSVEGISVPYLLVPRGESRVDVSNPRRVRQVRGLPASWEVTVKNSGAIAGAADIFAWQLTDRRGDAPRGTDIVNVGIQTFVDVPSAGESLSMVAVGFAGTRSTAADRDVVVVIDVNGDDDPDYYLLGTDAGWVDGYATGRWASHVVDAATGDVLAVYEGAAPANSAVVLLPFQSGDLGLVAGGSAIRYSVATFELYGEGFDEVPDWATWDVLDPQVRTGQWVMLAPRQSASVELGSATSVGSAPVGAARRRVGAVLGYLVVSLDDRGGRDQVDAVIARRP